MRYLIVLGRVLFSAVFIASGYTHFQPGTIAFATGQGVPGFLVPLSGLLALAGGLSIAFGVKARWGAWAVVLFLVPVTLTMHQFWGLADPQAAMAQQAHFMKNLSMLGGALVIACFGSGPLSVDNKRLTKETGRPRELREPAGQSR